MERIHTHKFKAYCNHYSNVYAFKKGDGYKTLKKHLKTRYKDVIEISTTQTILH